MSYKDNLDLTTPSGRLMFQVIGAIAEFERALIQERVKAGLRNAKAKGKTLGRPKRLVDYESVARLRAQGLSWAKIAGRLEVGGGTVRRMYQRLAIEPESICLWEQPKVQFAHVAQGGNNSASDVICPI